VRRKLLVVDDDAHIRRLIQIYLRGTDFDVVDRGTGEEAVAIAAQQPFDVALIDVILPFFGGFRVAQKLKSAQPAPRVVVMSGDETQREAAAGYGADAFLAKPFTKEELVAALSA
jgi:DNA-binding response OmpR family regulator